MKSKKELLKIIFSALRPLKKIRVSEWANQYRMLPTTSAEPGKWKTSRAPYTKDIMDAFVQQGIYKVVVMSAAQLGKTSVLENLLGYYAHIDPCNIMMMMPTLELAQDFSKDRFERLIQDSKVLTPLFYGDKSTAKSRDRNQTMLSKFFRGGRLVLVGSNSAASLASRPIRILLCDEVDRFPDVLNKEGDPLSLAVQRTSNYWNKKIGLFSTPTVKNASRIEIEFLNGTQEYWQHKCPNCGEFHKMDWRRMQVDYSQVENDAQKSILVKDVRFCCPDCGKDFSEIEMKQAEQKYIAENPDALQGGCRSFWINSFSSPWVKWNDIMQKYLMAKGDNVREQVVFNTNFGESYQIKRVFADENEFMERREVYSGELCDPIKILTCAVDVQHNRLEFEVCGWGVNYTRYGVWRGVILGAPTDVNTWAQFDTQVLQREYHYASGAAISISRTFIDSGYSTAQVYWFCRARMTDNVFPIKGKGGSGLPLIYQYSYPKGSGVAVVILGVNDGKGEVVSGLNKNQLESGSYHFPADDEFFAPRGYDQVYFKQLLSEQRVIKTFGGVAYVAWETTEKNARNESLDLAVYSLAAIRSLAPDWKIYEEKIEVPQPAKKKKPDSKQKKIVQTRLNIF